MNNSRLAAADGGAALRERPASRRLSLSRRRRRQQLKSANGTAAGEPAGKRAHRTQTDIRSFFSPPSSQQSSAGEKEADSSPALRSPRAAHSAASPAAMAPASPGHAPLTVDTSCAYAEPRVAGGAGAPPPIIISTPTSSPGLSPGLASAFPPPAYFPTPAALLDADQHLALPPPDAPTPPVSPAQSSFPLLCRSGAPAVLPLDDAAADADADVESAGSSQQPSLGSSRASRKRKRSKKRSSATANVPAHVPVDATDVPVDTMTAPPAASKSKGEEEEEEVPLPCSSVADKQRRRRQRAEQLAAWRKREQRSAREARIARRLTESQQSGSQDSCADRPRAVSFCEQRNRITLFHPLSAPDGREREEPVPAAEEHSGGALLAAGGSGGHCHSERTAAGGAPAPSGPLQAYAQGLPSAEDASSLPGLGAFGQ